MQSTYTTQRSPNYWEQSFHWRSIEVSKLLRRFWQKKGTQDSKLLCRRQRRTTHSEDAKPSGVCQESRKANCPSGNSARLFFHCIVGRHDTVDAVGSHKLVTQATLSLAHSQRLKIRADIPLSMIHVMSCVCKLSIIIMICNHWSLSHHLSTLPPLSLSLYVWVCVWVHTHTCTCASWGGGGGGGERDLNDSSLHV